MYVVVGFYMLSGYDIYPEGYSISNPTVFEP